MVSQMAYIKIVLFIRGRQSFHIKSIERVILAILSPTLFYGTIYATAHMFYMNVMQSIIKIERKSRLLSWTKYLINMNGMIDTLLFPIIRKLFFCNINIEMPFSDLSLVKIEYTVLVLLLHHPHQSHGHYNRLLHLLPDSHVCYGWREKQPPHQQQFWFAEICIIMSFRKL